ncbi:MAG: hypothetical protein D6808_02700, partial [Candidatus Dadabacteria bacterium]
MLKRFLLFIFLIHLPFYAIAERSTTGNKFVYKQIGNKKRNFKSLGEFSQEEFFTKRSLEAIHKAQKRIKAIAKEKPSFRYRPIPLCAENRTEKKGRKLKGGDKDKVLLDKLFIRKGKLPLSYRDYFGRTVEAFETDLEGKSLGSMVASGMNIPCVPYRIRVVGGIAYRHMGKDALKNYDGKPHGKGRYLLD